MRMVSARISKVQGGQALPHPADGLLRGRELVLIEGVAFEGVGELQGRQHKAKSPGQIMTLGAIFCNHTGVGLGGDLFRH